MGNGCSQPRQKLLVDTDELMEEKMLSFENLKNKVFADIKELHQKPELKKAISCKEFMHLKGEITVARVNNKLAAYTMRQINWYQNEWVSIQLMKNWQASLKGRRQKVDNLHVYTEIYDSDIKGYKKLRDQALKDILQCSKISMPEYTDTLYSTRSDGNFLLEEFLIVDFIWTYWQFKDANKPVKLSDDEMICAIAYMKDLAKEKPDTPKFLYEKGQDSLIEVWLGEKMEKDQIARYEDFYLTMLGHKKTKENDPKNMAIYDSYIELRKYYWPTLTNTNDSFLN